MASIGDDNGISVGGLASGLDTNAIIDGLVRIEQQRIDNEVKKQSDYQLRLDKFTELNSKIGDLAEKAKSLDNIKAFNLFNSTSSNDDLATIDGDTDATVGNYDVNVLGLASSLKVASKSFSSQVAALGLSGSFTLSMSKASQKADPTVTSVQVDIAANDTLKDIAAKINRVKGAGAVATMVQMGINDFRLMLTGADEGTEAFTLDKVGATTLLTTGLDLVTNKKSTRTEFDFRLQDGGPATSTTTFDELFRGIGTSYDTGDVIHWTATDSAGNAQNGSFTIDLGDASFNDVGDLLSTLNTVFDDAANRVNATLNASGELVITDNTAGGASEFVLSMDVNGTSLGAGAKRTDFKNVISDGKNAFYLLNDLSVSSQSNVDETTVVGTKIKLKKVDPTETVKLTLNRDQSKIMEKVRDFIVSYNSVVKFIDENTKVSTQDKSGGNLLDQLKGGSSSKDKPKRGPFAGDSSILGLKQELTNLMTNRIDLLTTQDLSTYSSLASIGITTKNHDNTLDLKDEDFLKALDTDFEGVRRLFMTSGYSNSPYFEYGTSTKDTRTGVYDINTTTNRIDTKSGASVVNLVSGILSGDNNIINSNQGDSKGLAVKFTAATTGQVTFIRGIGGQIKLWNDRNNDFVNGFATNTKKSLNDRIKSEQKRIDQLQDHVDRFRQRLINQFSQLEINIARLQQQSGAFQNSGVGIRR